MPSFHRSRGRIFFEVLCAFTISASLSAPGCRPARGLLSFSRARSMVDHAFDLGRRDQAEAGNPRELSCRLGRNRLPHKVADARGRAGRPSSTTTTPSRNCRCRTDWSSIKAVAQPINPKSAVAAPTRKEAKVTELTPPMKRNAHRLPSQRSLSQGVDFDECGHISHARCSNLRLRPPTTSGVWPQGRLTPKPISLPARIAQQDTPPKLRSHWGFGRGELRKFLTGAALAALIAAATQAAPTYIHAGRLIDVPGKAVRGPSTIIVDNGRIVSVIDPRNRDDRPI